MCMERLSKSIVTTALFAMLVSGSVGAAEPAFPIEPGSIAPVIEKASKSKGSSSSTKSKAKADDKKASVKGLPAANLLKERAAKVAPTAASGKGSATKSKVTPSLLKTPRGSAAASKQKLVPQLPPALGRGTMPKAASSTSSDKKGAMPRLPGLALPKLPGKLEKAPEKPSGGVIGNKLLLPPSSGAGALKDRLQPGRKTAFDPIGRQSRNGERGFLGRARVGEGAGHRAGGHSAGRYDDGSKGGAFWKQPDASASAGESRLGVLGWGVGTTGGAKGVSSGSDNGIARGAGAAGGGFVGSQNGGGASSTVPRGGNAGAGVGPSYDAKQDAYVFSDGRRVRATDNAGRRGVVQPDGSVRYADGTNVRHDTTTGVTTITKPDGSQVELEYGRGNRNERPQYNETTDTFVFSDGKGVRGTDPNGNRGQVREDGSIEYSDGTVITHDTDTGETIIRQGDKTRVDERGSKQTDGPVYDEENNTYVYDGGEGKGTRIRATDPSGNRGTVQEDGSIVYSDGTRIERDSTRGQTLVRKPDGSRIIYYADGTVVEYNASTGETTRRRSGSPTSSADTVSGSSGEDDTGDGDSGTAEDKEQDSDTNDQDGDENSDDGQDQQNEGDDGGDDSGGEDNENGADDEATEYVTGLGSGNRRSSVTAPVDDAVARKRGEKTDPETGCSRQPSRGRSGPNVRPSGEGSDREAPCMEDVAGKEDEEKSPNAADYVTNVDTRLPGSGLGPDCDERIMDCNAGLPLRTVDPFDQSPVINPNPTN